MKNIDKYYIVRYMDYDNSKTLRPYSITGPYNNNLMDKNQLFNDLHNMISKESFLLNLDKSNNSVYLLASNEEEGNKVYYIYYLETKNKKELDKLLEEFSEGLIDVDEIKSRAVKFEIKVGYKIHILDESDIKNDNTYFTHMIAIKGDRDNGIPTNAKCFNEYKSYEDACNELIFYATARAKTLELKDNKGKIDIDCSTAAQGEVRIYKKYRNKADLLETICLIPLDSFSDKFTLFYTYI